MKRGDDIARCGVSGDDSWTLTFSGKHLTYLNPEVGEICLVDIAKHLSQICRFTGATSQFYSVAQHSIFVAQLVKQELDDAGAEKTAAYWNQVLAAILHDAEETYVQDLASPIKYCMGGRYRLIARGIQRKVFENFGIDWGYHNVIVKAADDKAVVIERFYLMPEHPDWPKLAVDEMSYVKPRCMEHDEAELAFTNAVRAILAIRDALILRRAK